MQLPVISGVIERRILANYRIDPTVVARTLPAPFRPRLIDDYAIGGICLIRLKAIKPKYMPLPFGFASENAAHRIAVEWDHQGQVHQGVYVPRRHTDSRVNALLGGRVFPGVQHLARFTTSMHDSLSGTEVGVALVSEDGSTSVDVKGRVTTALPSSSVFSSLDAASLFFAEGSEGYSPNQNLNQFDGMELRCKQWNVEPLELERCESSYFEDLKLFPSGSLSYDCALLMRNIEHEWHPLGNLCCV